MNLGFSYIGLIFLLMLMIPNIIWSKYYNHLSFYRKVEIPEPGRSFQISIKVPFKQLLKWKQNFIGIRKNRRSWQYLFSTNVHRF